MAYINRLWLTLASSCLLAVCSQVSGDSTPRVENDGGADSGARDSFSVRFPSDEVLDVELELRAEDWDRLRSQGRSLNDVFSGCSGSYDYSLMDAKATIDGRSQTHLQVRKKGYLGSLSTSKPSLRIEFGDQLYRGQRELTLNNNRSDPTLMHQCLAYQLFAEAGLPASHCAFANVSVNGQRLGTYTNVEPVKRGFLERYFGSDEGNLYEGSSLADFRAGTLTHFERKNNRNKPEIAELEAVAAALELEDDGDMVAALEPLIDLEKYIRFWATEVLVGHWDGYAGNTNNVYVYLDPSSHKLQFIPWGTDQAFEKEHPYLPRTGRPPVTLAYSRLPRRLYAYAPTRERYYAELRDLLAHVWDESRLHGQIDRMSALLGDAPDHAAVAKLRAFIDTRRDEVEQELRDALVPWSIPERGKVACVPQYTSKITGAFSTTWGTLGRPPKSARSAFELDVDGGHRSAGGMSSAGALESTHAAIRLRSVLEDGRYLVVHFELPKLPKDAPTDVPLHGFETFGVVVVSAKDAAARTLGYIGTGAIHFEHASSEDGGEVSGSFEAQFSQTDALQKL